MKYLMIVALALACTDATTAPRSLPRHVPSFAVITTVAPVLASATVVGAEQGFPVVRVTFTDVADDEALISAYFVDASGAAVTQGIGAQPGTGDHTIDLYGPPNVVSVRLNYMWRDAAFTTQCGCLFGPFSNMVGVTDGVVVVTTKKHKR